MNKKNKNDEYPTIYQIKNYEKGNKKGSIAFLTNFYTEVWAKYTSYSENDKKLYEIFSKEYDKDFMVDARVCLLNWMYGTRINSTRNIIKIIKKFENSFDSDSVNKMLLEVDGVKKEGDEHIRNETSFFSKYCHWYNEVNNKTPLPIYDQNVRVGLLIYEGYDDSDKIKKRSFKEKQNINYVDGPEGFLERMNLFITKQLELKEVNCRVTINLSDGLKTEVSIHRLVDKFLWLMYKINKDLRSAEGEMISVIKNWKALKEKLKQSL